MWLKNSIEIKLSKRALGRWFPRWSACCGSLRIWTWLCSTHRKSRVGAAPFVCNFKPWMEEKEHWSPDQLVCMNHWARSSDRSRLKTDGRWRRSWMRPLTSPFGCQMHMHVHVPHMDVMHSTHMNKTFSKMPWFLLSFPQWKEATRELTCHSLDKSGHITHILLLLSSDQCLPGLAGCSVRCTKWKTWSVTGYTLSVTESPFTQPKRRCL